MEKTNASEQNGTGVLLLLNSPKNMRLGIDHQSWQIGAKFKGIKAIPAGPHYIHYSLEDEGHQYKISFFVFVKPNSATCRKWNDKRHQFVKMSEEEEEAYIEGIKNHDFDLSLGLYPAERYELWRETTNYITEPIINKLEVIYLIIE